MLDGKKIDRLPEEYCKRKMEEIGKVVSEYYSKHRDEWRLLCQHLEEEKDNPELERQRMRRFD